MIHIRKTTIGEYHSGHCRSRNNARFKGVSTVWVLYWENEAGEQEDLLGLLRKSDAEAVKVWADRNWDGHGELETAFINAMVEKGKHLDWGRFKTA